MIRVLVVDDSPTSRMLLTRVLESVPDIRVVATASDGLEALSLVQELKPDLVTMDVRMPRMNGLEATERIMATNPMPIVVVASAADSPESRISFNALRAGALDVIEKPTVEGREEFERIRSHVVDTVRAMSEIRVVRRRVPAFPVPAPVPPRQRFHLVCVGASTGGPQLLVDLFSRLPPDFPVPIVVVQHMTPGFLQGFARWLAQESKLDVRLAADGDTISAGTVFIAPDGVHARVDARWRIALGSDEPVGHFRPSIDVLFRSAAENVGARTIGLLLTGMGTDGASGLKAIRGAGGRTLAQDAGSCMVSGMPDTARALDAVDQSVSPDSLPFVLSSLTTEAKVER